MPEALLGMNAKLSRNTGTHGTPVWDEVTCVKDLKCGISRREFDASTRGSGGIAEAETALADFAVEGQLQWNPTDADAVAFFNAVKENTGLEIKCTDGHATADTGVSFNAKVFGFDRDEPLDGGQMIDITLKPAPTTYAPSFLSP